MVLTITRIVILLFTSTIMMLLAAHSTTAKARIKRTSFVYLLVASFLIASDANLILGIIEVAIFLVVIAFSAISCLYAYADIEIAQKKSADEECTALVVIPFKKTEVEVTSETVISMDNLAFIIFCTCLIALMIIRPTLLFPFYGKNPVLFIVSLIITILNFWIASASGGTSSRAIDNLNSDAESSAFIVIIIALIVYGFVQLFAFFAYDFADDKAKEAAAINGIPRAYGKMLPLNELHHLELPSYIAHEWSESNDEIYLVEDTYASTSGYNYYCNLYGLDFYEIKDKRNNCKVVIHLLEEDDKETPYMDIYDSYYINPKGEEDIASTLYSIYIKKEQILTY